MSAQHTYVIRLSSVSEQVFLEKPAEYGGNPALPQPKIGVGVSITIESDIDVKEVLEEQKQMIMDNLAYVFQDIFTEQNFNDIIFVELDG